MRIYNVLCDLALLAFTPSTALAGSLVGKVSAVGVESVDDSAYLVISITSCDKEMQGCRALVVASSAESPLGRAAQSLATAALVSSSTVTVAFDDFDRSPLDSVVLRSIVMSSSMHPF